KIINIDSRPSDAIALAVRAHVPVMVSQAVMDEAGIVPEKNIQEEAPSEPVEKPGAEAEPEDEKRLDVFEDFLKKLGTDKGDEEKPKS
ncbi:MAG: bifunctional nuclease family protein, partial [Candidatus Atribacteria bacterium]|nr:bifunctional nuclease family protein [Candidatus Atribacteria bacterium]